jgi:hypothetical protein
LILSAAWALVHPDDEITPYDRTLRDTGQKERVAWAGVVASRLHGYRYGPSARLVVEVHAGADYREFLVDRLTGYGMTVEVPLEGLRLGEQKRWYRERAVEAAA